MKLYLSTTAPWYFCARWPDEADTTNTGAVEEVDPDGRHSWPSRILHALADAALAFEDEARPLARPLRERMLREREEQWERAKARLEAAMVGRAA